MARVHLLLTVALLGPLITAQACIDNEIRTVRDGERDFIQYCVRGEWRLHCTGRSRWRFEEATVACRQLGYSGVMRMDRGLRASDPGAANTDNFFSFSTQCEGNEISVQECGGDVREMDNCTSSQHGIAVCLSAGCTNGEIRLVNGSTNREGRVEVCVDGRWGTVCNNQEGLAGAVCAQMGFPKKGALVSTVFTPSTPPILTCTIQSDEADPIQYMTAGSCDLSPSLGVVCKSHQEDAQILQNETFSLDNDVTLINEILQQKLIVQSITPALGAVIGFLVVVLIVGAVGWRVTCAKLSRECNAQKKNTPFSANPAGDEGLAQQDLACNPADAMFKLQGTPPASDEGSADQPSTSIINITGNPAYMLFKRDPGDDSEYEVVDTALDT